MEAIYLIGFMGAGKTTVSKELARKLSVAVYDTDAEIVKAAGKPIKKIFAEEGEERFRDMESSVLESMPVENAVIATGGGIILSEVNRKVLKSRGNIVFLSASMEAIQKRLEGDTSRPLLLQGNFEATKKIYLSRIAYYRETADFEIDTTTRSAEQVVDEIIRRMNG